ncbi:hypothetical protein QJS04_geneDACA011233 [Acorus gramineus]|uniref:Uncharacterized protein n=1 Tax=Acorus gramineus TaxID=55184 RepID=A0AAV9AKY6_ACOGR|nr:hypothetical protein QJS04_geneDACA011233 [Acorus gramineus]
MRVRERCGARVFEIVRVRRRPTRAGAVVLVPAAQLVRPERLAPALTPHDVPSTRGAHLKRSRARREQVRAAAHDGADPVPLVRGDCQGDVEAVDEADAVGGVVGAGVVEVELRESGGGGAAEAGALEAAAAVAGEAGEAVVGVGAAGAGPDSARPGLVRGGEGAVGEGVEGEAAVLEDGVARVGLDGGPDGVGAVVDEGESEGVQGDGAGGEDKEEGEEDSEEGLDGHCFFWCELVRVCWVMQGGVYRKGSEWGKDGFALYVFGVWSPLCEV